MSEGPFSLGATKKGLPKFNLPKNPFPLIPLLVWGDFPFKVSTAAPSTENINQEYNWVKMDRVGARPVYQFTGIGEESFVITGTIYTELRFGISLVGTTGNKGLPVGTRQMDDLYQSAGGGEVHPLFDGRGAYWGNWFIKNINEVRTNLANMGAPRKQEFSITFIRAGRDRLESDHISYSNLLKGLIDDVKVAGGVFS